MKRGKEEQGRRCKGFLSFVERSSSIELYYNVSLSGPLLRVLL